MPKNRVLQINTTPWVPVTSNWQLQTDHYVAAKMEPVIIHPRPDSETNAWERHRRAPDGIEWRIPIGVQGGAWPFRYTVDATSAAAGFTIGETYGTTDYGVLSHPNPVIGTYTITVTVYTQEYGRNTSGLGDSLSVTFTLAVSDKNDTSKFVFLDGTAGSDSNSGSYSSPKRTLSSVFGSTAYAGAQVFLADGTYNTSGAGTSFTMDASHPCVLVALPSAAPVISFTSANFTVHGPGVFFAPGSGEDGGYGSTVANARYVGIYNKNASRFTASRFVMTDPSNGTSGDSNPSTFMSDDPGTSEVRNYHYWHECEEIGRPLGSTNSGVLAILWNTDGFLFERCVVNGASAQGHFLKDGTLNGTVRECEFRVNGRTSASGCQNNTPVSMNIEWCYNLLVHTGSGSAGSYNHAFNIQSNPNCGNHWTYRNTIIGPTTGLSVRVTQGSTSTAGPFVIERCVLQNGSATPGAASRVTSGTQISYDSYTDACSGNAVVDSSGALLPAYAAYEGIVGHRVS